MRSYQNPFRARASEQYADPRTFVRQFGAGVLDLLPETIWDRPLLLRSAPGGGKTSLMRLFTLESMALIDQRRDEFPDLVERLEALGALTEEGPTHLGVLLNLERDYRSLVDLGTSDEEWLRLFLRLLDARILVAVVRAALRAKRLSFPDSLDQVRLQLLPDRPGIEEVAESLGGTDGRGLVEHARAIEREVLAPLDSLLPIEAPHAHRGHAELDSLRLLSDARLVIAGQELAMRPLVMLDDGHHLVTEQREQLLKRLADRALDVGRWYSERFEALSAEEVMVGSIVGRDFELLELESEARRASTPGGRSRFRYERVVLEVGNRRAYDALKRYADTEESLFDLLSFDENAILGDREHEILASLRERLRSLARGRERYERWLEEIDQSSGYEGALELRTLEILIHGDEGRAQRELFDLVLDEDELERRKRSSSRIREASGLFLAREFNLPYYSGPELIAKLGSHNMEQFLALCGDLFEHMLGEITLGRRPRVPPAQQDRIIRRASERFWREIPQRLPHGRTVQRLIEAIVSFAQKETFRETAPYAPGVTGTALTMREREALLTMDTRTRLPGAQALFDAIGSAVASNVLSVDLDYSVKNQRVMVIYLNRLLCPRFWLPLGRGGFRERRLEVMAGWLADPRRPLSEEPIEVYEPERLTV